MNQKTITNIFKYTIISGLFIIPFISLIPLPFMNALNPLFFPFIGPKAFIFRIIVEIIFAAWLVLIWRDKSYAPKFSWMTGLVTLFTVIALVADLLGVNPLRSIWSNFERMEGWMTIVHLWGYFMVLTSVFTEKKWWDRFFHTTLAAAGIVAIYGLTQLFGWSDIHQSGSRLDASLGNSAYLGVYMIMHAFIAAYMASVMWVKNNKFLAWIYLIAAALFGFIIFETQTRGSILGLMIGLFVALVVYLIKQKNEKTGVVVAATGLGLIIVLSITFFFLRNTAFILNNAVFGRIASISINDTKTQARGYVWPMAVKGAFSSPKTAIIGWGQENFNYIFNANYNPEMYGQEQWFDRAHSVFLDWLVAGGLLGLLSYLALFVLALVSVWKSDLNAKAKATFIGVLIAYGIHNVFVFDNLSSYILFFSVLAFIYSLRPSRPIALFQKNVDPVIQNYIIFPVATIALLVTLYFINIRPIQASTRLIDALVECRSGGQPTAALFQRALALNQYVANQEIREQLYSCAASIIKSTLPVRTKADFFDLSLKAIEDQTTITPKDARAFILGGSFLDVVDNFQEATPYLEKANELSPNKQTIMFDLATNYLNTNKSQQAVDLLKKAYELEPAYDTAKVAYATALVNAGQEKKAHELFGDDPKIFNDQRVINAYISTKQFDKVIAIYKKLVEQNPADLQNHLYLADAYMASKQSALAIKELNYIKEKAPQYRAQMDEIIKKLQEGKDPLGQ